MVRYVCRSSFSLQACRANQVNVDILLESHEKNSDFSCACALSNYIPASGIDRNMGAIGECEAISPSGVIGGK